MSRGCAISAMESPPHGCFACFLKYRCGAYNREWISLFLCIKFVGFSTKVTPTNVKLGAKDSCQCGENTHTLIAFHQNCESPKQLYFTW